MINKERIKLIKQSAKGIITNEALAGKINCTMEEARLLTNDEITKLFMKMLKEGQ